MTDSCAMGMMLAKMPWNQVKDDSNVVHPTDRNGAMAIVLIGGLLIGLTLGMLGSGGSAITVPVLIYLVGHGTKESIAESMAIVGLISVVVAIPYARSHQVDWRSVWCFGIPGMLGTYFGAWLGGVAPEALQLIVFGGVLLAAAYAMLKKPNKVAAMAASPDEPPYRAAIWIIGTEGMLVGMVTGFVGVGGGFLIVPALVVIGRLPIRLAIGTSLVIIALNAAIGFAKYEHYLLGHHLVIDRQTIIAFALIGMVGSFIGKAINARLNQQRLKRVFAIFLIVLGGFVMIHEGIKWANGPESHATTSVECKSQNHHRRRSCDHAAPLKEGSDVTAVFL